MAHPRPNSVLILEDEALVSLMLEELVREMGGRVIDVFGAASEALRAIAAQHYDLAVLDVVVRDGMSTAVADALDERGIPFLFSSAMGPEDLEARHRDRPLVTKPFEDTVLRSHLAALLPPRQLAV
jgi:CheY-like chemotaxis protein